MKRNPNTTSGTSPTLALVLRPRGLRPPAAAAYLGTTAFYVEQLMREGALPFRIVGGARVIAIEDLDKYFDSLAAQAGTLPGRGIHVAKQAA